MAKLRIFKEISNKVYILRFENDPLSLSNADKELMQKYGEPEINIGGVFLASTGNTYTLPEEYVKIRSGFPFKREFDTKETFFATNTAVKVDAYSDTITSRFTAALAALRANTDAFTSETITNI